jgi:hypothetical protein
MKKLITLALLIVSINFTFAQSLSKKEQRKQDIETIAQLRTDLGQSGDNTYAVAEAYKGQKDLQPVVKRLQADLEKKQKKANANAAPASTTPAPATLATSATTPVQATPAASITMLKSFQTMYEQAKKDDGQQAKSFKASLKNAGITDRNVKNLHPMDMAIQGWEVQTAKTENGKTTYAWTEILDNSTVSVLTDGSVCLLADQRLPIRKGKFLNGLDQKRDQALANRFGVKLKELDTKFTKGLADVNSKVDGNINDISELKLDLKETKDALKNVTDRLDAIQDTSKKGKGIQAQLSRLTSDVHEISSTVSTRSIVGGISLLIVAGFVVALFQSNKNRKDEFNRFLESMRAQQTQQQPRNQQHEL